MNPELTPHTLDYPKAYTLDFIEGEPDPPQSLAQQLSEKAEQVQTALGTRISSLAFRMREKLGSDVQAPRKRRLAAAAGVMATGIAMIGAHKFGVHPEGHLSQVHEGLRPQDYGPETIAMAWRWPRRRNQELADDDTAAFSPYRGGERRRHTGAIILGGIAVAAVALLAVAGTQLLKHDNVDVDTGKEAGKAPVAVNTGKQDTQGTDKGADTSKDATEDQAPATSTGDTSTNSSTNKSGTTTTAPKPTQSESHPTQHHHIQLSDGRTAIVSRLDFYGDTLWGSVKWQLKHRGYNTSTSKVARVTRAVLHDEGLSYRAARHLPVGYEFRYPRSLLKA
jgi:hypothetical protein